MTEQMDSRFLTARKNYIERQFSQLNDMQRQAVLTTEGPLLLLAGAGSGKTTVLINRIANLMRFGRGSDCCEISHAVTEDDVAFLESLGDDPSPDDTRRADSLCAVEPAAPWSIIAITFTNKAANEMKERLSNLLGSQAQDIWAMTFHSACCRILRRDIERMGFTRSFTIYDSSDSERIMKEIIKDMELDDKTFPAKYVLGAISREKDKMVSPGEMLDRAERTGDIRAQHIARAYGKYQTRLKDNNALDFDDIIYITVQLLQQNEDVLQYYQRKFRYVLVDEYQDTNHLQYLLTSLLAGGYRNICVVGDDDQSIYRFRGANIENILSFEKEYRGARVIRLEQNYRSTQNILDAANAVIRHNQGRKGKTLWTRNGAGDKVLIKTNFNEGDEANFVVGQVMMNYNRGMNWRDHAVLYRMNAQSNALEYAFKRSGVPYKIIGGMKFFDRAEIKDMLAYLCVINNPTDDLRLRRIVNVPSRKIGAATVDKAQLLATAHGVPLYEIFRHASGYPELRSAAVKLEGFTALMEEMREKAGEMPLPEFYEFVCNRSGYTAMLTEKNDMESRGRLENVQELTSSIHAFLDNQPDDPSLSGFLDEVALYTDLDSTEESDNCVVMMTMHSAKGLEFPEVFVVGMEDGLFPGNRAMGDEEEMEEERRLCYVAMTRAREHLTMTHAKQRMLFGRTTPAMPSRFLEEIPEENSQWVGKPEPRQERHWSDDYNDDTAYGGFGGGYTGRGTVGYAERPTPKKPAYVAAAAAKKESAPLMEIKAGESVKHAAFGHGLVLSVRAMGGDALIEVAFDTVGTKKLMLRAAMGHLTKG